jgi:pentatricopeptide repeat protein
MDSARNDRKERKRKLKYSTVDINTKKVTNEKEGRYKISENPSEKRISEPYHPDGELVTSQYVVQQRQYPSSKVKIINIEISSLAKRKQLKLVQRKIEWMKKKGYAPDIYTYASLLNAHVRCGDREGAKDVLFQLKDLNISLNTVTYTTILRGYCESGNPFLYFSSLFFSSYKASIWLSTVYIILFLSHFIIHLYMFKLGDMAAADMICQEMSDQNIKANGR